MRTIIIGMLVSMVAFSISAQNYYENVVSGGLWVNVNGSNGIKISTNIPAPLAGSNTRSNISVFLEGFDMTEGIPINLSIVWKMWNEPAFSSYSVTSFGTYRPKVSLGVENGKVVIWLDEGQLHHDIHVRAHSRYYDNPSWFEGWSISNANISNATGVVQLPYKNFEVGVDNAYYPSVKSGRVWVAANSSAGVKFVTNIPISQPGSNTRHDMLFIIEGFDNYAGKPFKIDFYWQMWNGPEFDKFRAYSDGNYIPQIKLGVENGKVVFWFDETGIGIHKGFHVSAYAGYHNNPSWFDDWSIGNAGLTSPEAFITVPVISNSGSGTSSYWNKNSENNLSYVEGAIGIGTTAIPSNYKLAIEGKAIMEEVKVQLSEDWKFPDYVFEKDYKLRSIKETKQYISTYKHLPEIPSAKEMEANGIDIGDMNMRLLKKVEELTLYIIEQNDRIEKLENERSKDKKP